MAHWDDLNESLSEIKEERYKKMEELDGGRYDFKNYNVIVPETKSIDRAISKGIFTELRVLEKPLVFEAKTGGDFYKETTHTFFPTVIGQNFYHAVFDKSEVYRSVETLPEKDNPRPDFDLPIWYHREISYFELDNYLLDLNEEFIKTFSPRVRDYLEENERVTVKEFLNIYGNEPYNSLYLRDMEMMLVYSQKGAFIDILSPERENIVSIAIDFEFERERELERVYEAPTTMGDIFQLMFRKDYEQEDEREYDDER